MGGPGSGPQKLPKTFIKEAIANDEKNLPEYFVKLSEMALEGDREALFYLMDRHLGKPKTNAVLELEGADMLGAESVKRIMEFITTREREIKQLSTDTSGSNLLPGGSEKAGNSHQEA